ncbi:hypothetical protein [Helicobacter typhlonius]|uniref:hypothetical protein n=1 Tax=Helicobacter typhlonius TaxID=76936 RepID=UPI002FDFCE00
MGGLGNQMFQYAFAKALQKHLQIPILLDKSWYDKPKYAKMFEPRYFSYGFSLCDKGSNY